MKNLAGVLALLLLSSSAEAALKMTYSGNLVNFLEGDFSGQLIFDPLTPEFSEYTPGQEPESANFTLVYGGNSIASTQLINADPFNIPDSPLFVYFEDNVTVTQADIHANGFNGIVSPGTYDFLSFELFRPDSLNLNLTGMFDSNAFSDNDLATANLQQLMNLPTPIYFLFEAERMNGPQAFRAAGRVTQFNVTEVSGVPIPGAAWLFVTVLSGLAFRQRRTTC